jgi:ABC-2 type transport system permease protein
MTRWHAYWQLLLSRFRIFYREWEAVFWVYGFPILLALGLGLAFASREPERPPVDIVGNSDDPQLKKEKAFLENEGFPVEINEAATAHERLATGETALVIQISDQGNHYHYDQTRAEGVLALRWVDALLLRNSNPTLPAPVLESVEEPGNRYIDFLLPGLMGLNLLGGGLWGVGFVIVDMRIRKLLKRMLATPMNRSDFLLSIMSARLIFLIPEQGLLLLFGWLAFGVPMRGSFLLLFLIMLLGSAAFSGLGLLIACRADKMETVSGLMNLIMLPMWIMGGAFFSSERFPDFMQPLIQALPLTQVNSAFREVMLKDFSLDQIAWRLAILAAWAVVTFTLALRFFRWR